MRFKILRLLFTNYYFFLVFIHLSGSPCLLSIAFLGVIKCQVLLRFGYYHVLQQLLAAVASSFFPWLVVSILNSQIDFIRLYSRRCIFEALRSQCCRSWIHAVVWFLCRFCASLWFSSQILSDTLLANLKSASSWYLLYDICTCCFLCIFLIVSFIFAVELQLSCHTWAAK